ncbi:hypothetical protein CKAH01_11320 [Colletotrichum kahawae]|uniref:Uncharacterized protein n=1 Tax=Colletotrichum kahawae TaxID=34407 RepID=A0AAD9YWD0_COLKA|nr:hypothetical protein CKAH01_11320 [Colletotrichum kahawae]
MPSHSSVTRGVLSTIPLPLLMQPRSLTGSHRELFPIRAVSSAVKSAFLPNVTGTSATRASTLPCEILSGPALLRVPAGVRGRSLSENGT